MRHEFIEQPLEPGTKLAEIDLDPLVLHALQGEVGRYEFISFEQRRTSVDLVLHDVLPDTPDLRFGVTVPVAVEVGDAQWQLWQPGADYWLYPYVQFAIVGAAIEARHTQSETTIDDNNVHWFSLL